MANSLVISDALRDSVYVKLFERGIRIVDMTKGMIRSIPNNIPIEIAIVMFLAFKIKWLNYTQKAGLILTHVVSGDIQLPAQCYQKQSCLSCFEEVLRLLEAYILCAIHEGFELYLSRWYSEMYRRTLHSNSSIHRKRKAPC